MKRIEGKSITLLLVMMLILMNLFAVPAWAAPGDVAINEANFPDATFRSYVSTNFDKDSNGVLSQGELDAVKEIDVNEKNITTLKGVEDFVKLEKLQCNYNQLTALDVTKNPKLTELNCENNQLTALDVTKNPNLSYLQCNYNQLTALDVTKNPNLGYLFCDSNQLTALDVTKNPNLNYFSCSNNQLTALDLTNKPGLTSLGCSNNQLTSLDLTANAYIHFYSIHNQKYNIEVSKSDLTFDLSSLPGSFDPSKASEWQGGTVSGNTLTLNDANTNKVTYKYEARSGRFIDVTLKVKYEGEIIISFNPGDGSGSMADVKVDKGSKYSLPACKFTAPAGKEFKAWEVGGVEKAVGDSITVNADTKVKALWKDKAVTPGTNPSDNPMTKELNVMTEGQNDINTLAKGNQLIYIVGKSTKAVFRILGEDLGVEDLKSVLLDGKLVDASNYDVSKGSIIVSFKKSYGDSLSPGTHEITFNTTKGVAKAELVVKQKTQTSTNITKISNAQPNTGDNTMLYVYTLELLLAASGMLILNARRNKKEQ